MVGINFSLIYIYNQIWCGFNLYLYFYKQKYWGYIAYFLSAVPCHAFQERKKPVLLREKGEGLRHRNQEREAD